VAGSFGPPCNTKTVEDGNVSTVFLLRLYRVAFLQKRCKK